MTDESEKLLTPRERDFLARYPEAKAPAETEQSRAGLRGVGGWLGFLIASLLVLSPLFSLGFALLDDTADLYPELAQHPAWQSLTILSWTLVGISIAISFFAGWRLNFRHTASSVNIAIVSLWLIGPVRYLVEWVLLNSVVGIAIGLQAYLADIVRSLIWTVLWTAYLLRSRRVKNTYRT